MKDEVNDSSEIKKDTNFFEVLKVSPELHIAAFWIHLIQLKFQMKLCLFFSSA
jgi:hypothetical protein